LIAHWGMRWCTAVIAAICLCGALCLPAAASTRPEDRVVLVGVPGLRWEDVRPQTTPVLWGLARRGAIANIAVRTVDEHTCAAEGWLTISAGARARPARDACDPPPGPLPAGSGAVVPGHARLRAHNAATVYAAQVGLLGETLRRAGDCAAGVGAGGALAAADSAGRVAVYRDQVHRMTAEDWRRCRVTVVDAAGLTTAPAQVDRLLGEVLRRVPADAAVLVVGVADAGRPGLRIAIDARPTSGPGRLTASSTRRTGLVTLTDVTPTVLRLAGAPVPARLTGAPWTPRPAPREGRVQSLRDRARAARTARSMVAPFNVALVGGQVVAFGLAALAWRRGGAARRRRIRAIARWTALAAAAAPAAAYLANLLPWWRLAHPAAGLAGAVLAADLVLVGVAVLGPWGRRPFGPVTAVAAATCLILAADAVAGSPLQADSLNGNFSLTAGRFYGFGNLTFAVFATAALFCAALLAARASRPRRAVATVAGIGGGAVLVDGWPGWGSDFGGVLALTPGVVFLTLWAAGRRPGPRVLPAASIAGALLVAVISWLDARRPPGERSHLGDFWHRVLNGEAGQILVRKADSMLGSLGSPWLTVPAAVALGLILFALVRPGGPLDGLFRRVPPLRPALLAVLITVAVGFVVNDSGIAVPAVAVLLAVPLTVAMALTAAAPEPQGCGAPAVPAR